MKLRITHHSPVYYLLIWWICYHESIRHSKQKIWPSSWKQLPTWYQVSENDHVIPPAVERMFAKEMNATTISLPSSHASLISHPNETVRSIPVMLIILLQIHYKRSYHEMLGNRQRYQTGMQYLHPRTRSLKRRSVLAVVGRTHAKKSKKDCESRRNIPTAGV